MKEAIAQMNWGKLRWRPDHPLVSPFLESLAEVYAKAAEHPGFIWRIPDDEIAIQAKDAGFDEKVSVTVSVWKTVESLRDYTYNSIHGQWLTRRSEWFEIVEGPQLVIWDVAADARPNLNEAMRRLHHLQTRGPSDYAYGWSK